jgi:hypothetical protein
MSPKSYCDLRCVAAVPHQPSIRQLISRRFALLRAFIPYVAIMAIAGHTAASPLQSQSISNRLVASEPPTPTLDSEASRCGPDDIPDACLRAFRRSDGVAAALAVQHASQVWTGPTLLNSSREKRLPLCVARRTHPSDCAIASSRRTLDIVSEPYLEPVQWRHSRSQFVN